METVNTSRLNWDVQRPKKIELFESYWRNRPFQVIPDSVFSQPRPVWLEVGAGSGWFFSEMASLYPQAFCVAIERSRMRGKRLVAKSQKVNRENFLGIRGNAIPALIDGIPEASVERVYILYPCPWPRNSQRRNRWYLHPIMPHLLRILKPGGLLIWASDQEFYIREAEHVSRSFYPLETLVVGPLTQNAYNDLEHFPNGRSKFEASFRKAGQPCYELISRKK